MISTDKLTGQINVELQTEIATINHLKRLDKIKTEITELNKLNNKNVKGFSANEHNYKRSSKQYSEAEQLFKDVLDLAGLKENLDYFHEFKIKVRDVHNRIHVYHLDFYFPTLKICVEINPLFHYRYEVVAIRDKLRASLLKRKLNIKTLDLRVYMKTRKGKTYKALDVKQCDKIINEILNKIHKPHKETLLFYNN